MINITDDDLYRRLFQVFGVDTDYSLQCIIDDYGTTRYCVVCAHNKGNKTTVTQYPFGTYHMTPMETLCFLNGYAHGCGNE